MNVSLILKIETEDLIRYVNKKVADHKKIRGKLTFVQSIPRNVVGKLQRSFLTKWANAFDTKLSMDENS